MRAKDTSGGEEEPKLKPWEGPEMKPRSWGRRGGPPSDVPLHPWPTARLEVAGAWLVLEAWGGGTEPRERAQG